MKTKIIIFNVEGKRCEVHVIRKVRIFVENVRRKHAFSRCAENTLS